MYLAMNISSLPQTYMMDSSYKNLNEISTYNATTSTVSPTTSTRSYSPDYSISDPGDLAEHYFIPNYTSSGLEPVEIKLEEHSEHSEHEEPVVRKRRDYTSSRDLSPKDQLLKRRSQNRTAQRSFRNRQKEHVEALEKQIKKLQNQVLEERKSNQELLKLIAIPMQPWNESGSLPTQSVSQLGQRGFDGFEDGVGSLNGSMNGIVDIGMDVYGSNKMTMGSDGRFVKKEGDAFDYYGPNRFY